MKLQQTLKNFGVNVTITNINCGPAAQPDMNCDRSGVAYQIVNLADDIRVKPRLRRMSVSILDSTEKRQSASSAEQRKCHGIVP